MPTIEDVLAGRVDHGQPVVFGGQLLAQSLVAAAGAVPGKQALSTHTVFARGADAGEPLELGVDVVHAGRSFATVTVTVSQAKGRCCHSVVLLHEPDPDLVRHAEPAVVPLPPAKADDSAWWQVETVGGVDVSDPEAVGPPSLQVWSRFPGAPDDPVVSQALLAYASDGFLIGTAMRPHRGVGQSMAHKEIATTVLAHTITFHEPFDAGGWLLLDHWSPYAGRGRSYGTAAVLTPDGRRVASYRQDNLIRA